MFLRVVGPALALLAGCLDAIPPDTLTGPTEGSVAGTVTSLCDGAAVAGATVLVAEVLESGTGSGRHATTGADGAFIVEGIGPGTWRVTVSGKGFQTADKSVLVASGRRARVDLTVSPVPKTLPASAKLDVLFVVDNSNSMEQEQQALASAFPSFMNTLMAYKFLLDLRVGVISTDMGAGPYNLPSCEAAGGDGGKLQSKPKTAGCTPPKDPFLSVVGSTTNVPGDMVNDAFSCIVRLGVAGCGFEQHLAAISRALDGKTNAGFPRQDSVLAVVVVSDEDDCSAADSALYDPSQQSLSDPLGPLTSFRCFEFGVTCSCTGSGTCDRTTTGPRTGCKPGGKYLVDADRFATDLKKSRGKTGLYFAVVGGPTDKVEVGTDGANPTLKPSCQTSMGFAVPAIRLKHVVDALQPASSFDTICQANLKTPMATIARRIVETALLNPCNAR